MIRSFPLGTVLLAAGLSFCAAGAAGAAATDWVGDAHATVRLITGSDGIDGSATLEAGLEFRYAADWHGYWRTPGDAGIAPVIDWSGSNNLQTPTVAWPSPNRLVVSGLQNVVYNGRFILPVRLGVADPHAPALIAVSVDYAACSNICVPEHADLSLSLPFGQGGPSGEAPAIAAARTAVPGAPAAAGIEVLRSSVQSTGSEARLVVQLRSNEKPFQHPDLFVEGAGAGIPPAPLVDISTDGRTATLTEPLPGGLQTDAPLTATVVDGDRSAEFPAAPSPIAQTGRNGSGLIAILASALLGGLILNLMPCVLPILSIKLFGLVRHAGEGRRAVRLGFVATAAGIVTCFLGLATVLIGLKLSGATLGWGIQFQQPWFLAALAVATVLFAASFFEWLPIGVPSALSRLTGTRSRIPLVEAFFTGAFSTLLATPCSAPFVGTAVGFALAEGPRVILAVFLCLGIGMALPFLAVALFPRLVAWLPRPGPWMVRLRQALGLLLLGTAAWLLVVLGSIVGAPAAAVVGLLLATILGFRAWVAHRAQMDRSWPKVATAALGAAVLAVAGLAATGEEGRTRDADGWQAFDSSAIGPLVADGKTVLVDVTASWCLTCKLNEVTTLETAQVQARLAQPGTIRMRADWSRPNPMIAAYLQHFGRFGIPLDVVYGPRRIEGEALPELLTAKIVIDALDTAQARAEPVTAAGDPP